MEMAYTIGIVIEKETAIILSCVKYMSVTTSLTILRKVAGAMLWKVTQMRVLASLEVLSKEIISRLSK